MPSLNSLRPALVQTILFCILTGKAIASGTEKTQTELTICHEANSYPPYIYTLEDNSTGLLVDIIEEAARLTSIKLTLYSSPWLRCQKDVQSGQADALFAMVITPEREKLYVFPPQHPDLYFLWQAQYPIFIGSNNKFDAKTYKPNTGFGAPLGYVVTDMLKKKNWLSDYAYSPSEGLQMVALGKLDGYVVERLIGESLLDQLTLSSKVQATKISLLNTNWYIPFNHNYYNKNKHKVIEFWQNVAISRQQIKNSVVDKEL